MAPPNTEPYRVSSGVRRPGFTLVEMLVATALILFIMFILTGAFVAGLDSFRQLKAIGDLEAKLRTAATQIRRDLSADHFEGKRRLSDPYFWVQGAPREGVFRILQPSPTGYVPPPDPPNPNYEGTDSMGIPSFHATTHFLQFTVKSRGNQPDKFFSASVPRDSPLLDPSVATNFFNQAPDGRFQEGDVYRSPWAEVSYSLVDSGITIGSAPTSLHLGTLYRSQLVVVPDNRALNWFGPRIPSVRTPRGPEVPPDYLGLSCKVDNAPHRDYLYFTSPNDLATGLSILTATPDLTQATILLPDVLSFSVRVLKYRISTQSLDPPDFTDLGDVSRGDLRDFTTNDSANRTARVNYVIKALEITIRVWDLKTEQVRQITIIQDM